MWVGALTVVVPAVDETSYGAVVLVAPDEVLDEPLPERVAMRTSVPDAMS